MTEKEKNILNQELWSLVSLVFEATKHDFEIMGKMLKCVSREDPDEMTPGKRKVIEELQLQWRFIKTIHEDIGKIAARLGKTGIVPAVPELAIGDELWAVGASGAAMASRKARSALPVCASPISAWASRTAITVSRAYWPVTSPSKMDRARAPACPI